MTEEVFMWVIAIAVLIVFISNLVVLWLFYVKVSPLIAKLQTTSDKVNPILGETQGIMSHVKDMAADIKPMVAEAQPLVRSILTKTNNGVEPILSETQGILGNARSISGTISNIVTDVQPSVRDIAAKSGDIAGMVYGRATEINSLIRDNVVPTAKDQVGRVDELFKRTTDRFDSTASTIEKDVIERIVNTTNDITGMAHTRANELSALLNDTILRVRTQVEQLDDLVRRTNDTVGSSITNIERQVTSPMREANYLGSAIRKGLSVLFDKDKSQTS